MSFNQTAAPTGWTKDATSALNDSIMRIVTGTVSSGGSVGYSSASVGATTLSLSQIPAHTHTVSAYASGTTYILSTSPFSNTSLALRTTSSDGGGGSHTHGFPDIKYNDFIIAQKD
jgi:microcystin-dependent protein